MPIVAQILYPVTSSHPHRTLAPNCRILSLLSHHPASLRSSRPRRRSVNVFRRGSSGRKVMDVTGLSSGDGVPGDGFVKKRKIVEHIFLLKAKDDLTEHDEKDMLDYLYTCQYQMSGILAISLGRIEVPNTDNFTHALYMRFQKKEDLAKFYKNSYYSKILREHVTPFSYVCHSTCCNLNHADNEYTHAAVIRFPSYVEVEVSSYNKKSTSNAFYCRSRGNGVDVTWMDHLFSLNRYRKAKDQAELQQQYTVTIVACIS
ncbi:uncharacterized protein LOC109714364 isoform X5 [Ananas comosus]|uniref:Uncharacterized protein LOC109705895 isoform X5 n=1 Tax=Ananas comosus TaxID=4615 RepID=A0A6P5ELH4_ANACO|nr:uncharacterized protein LOC109705895 isoform X5 [Ananas comosus]XP_020094555.1 uncharacterized protein LOC109714364 isoform X5 [Ananas comosus]